MRLRALKTIYGEGKMTRRGQPLVADKARAMELIAMGYAEAEPEPQNMVAAPQNPHVADEVKADPFEALPTGGRTGAGKRQSSLPEDQAPRKRRSTSREDVAE